MYHENLIIGGGVAGLITAFYNENMLIIDKSPLGQIASQFILGPRILKTDVYTEKFLKKLGIDFKKETIKIGYTENGYELVECDNTFKIKYSVQTRGTDIVEKSFLSSSQSEIEIFTDGTEDFYKKVFEKVYSLVKDRVISETVIDINLKKRILTTCSSTFFLNGECISTINLKTFCILAGIDNISLETKFKHFVCCEYTNEADVELSKKYSYIYNIGSFYSRKTYYKDYIVYETLTLLNQIDSLEGNKVIKIINNLPIQIKNSVDIRNIAGIEMVGRFAQWAHSIKANEIIEKYETARFRASF